MKNIFFLLSVLSLCIFSSCKKCKDCSCSQVITQTGAPDVTQNVEFNDMCDEDLEEIEGTITYTQNVGGFTQTVEQSCDCN